MMKTKEQIFRALLNIIFEIEASSFNMEDLVAEDLENFFKGKLKIYYDPKREMLIFERIVAKIESEV